MKLSEQQLYNLTNNALNATILARKSFEYHEEFYDSAFMVQHYAQNIIRILMYTL